MNKHFIFTGLSLLSVIGLSIFYFLPRTEFILVRGLFFVFYFFINSLWLGKILKKFLNLEEGIDFLLGLFLLLFLIGFGLAIPIFFYKITPFYFFIFLIFLTLLISVVSAAGWSPKKTQAAFVQNDGYYQPKKIFYFLFSIFYFLALALLFLSRTGEFILSPWQVIRPYYLYLWFGLVFLTCLFIFSKAKISRVLLIIILASLLCHAYLPIIYQTGFGGDKWRHLGAERYLMEGRIYSPALFGEEVRFKNFGPIKIPEVFVIGNKNSYANLWGMTIGLSWMSGINPFYIDLFLGYLLFSIFLPILLFEFAKFFSSKKTLLGLVAFLPLIFSPFQIYGSITVPLSFGFLWFLFCLIILFKNIFIDKEINYKLIGGLLILSFFNYFLYFILLIEILIFSLLIKKIALTKKQFSNVVLFILFYFLFSIFYFLLIPLADTYGGLSRFKDFSFIKTNFLISLFDFIKRLIVSAPIFPRIFNMEQDNWLFAQISEYSNRASLLKVVPWHLILTPIVWIGVIFGLLKMKFFKTKIIGKILAIFLLIILVNQFIASYFMEGNHIFSKRLVMMTSFLILVFLSWGIWQFVQAKILTKKVKIIFIGLFLAFLSTTVYASGPKMQTVTSEELLAAKILWQEIKAKELPYCVLANTWPLLALENESARKVVAGGFPFYTEYRQPERVQLFAQMNKEPSIRYLEKTLEITGAKECYFMTEEKWMDYRRKDEIIEKIRQILGLEQKIGRVLIWRYGR